MKTLRVLFSCGILLLCLTRAQSVVPVACVSDSTEPTPHVVVSTEELSAPAVEAAEKWHVRYAKRKLRAERRKLLRDVS